MKRRGTKTVTVSTRLAGGAFEQLVALAHRLNADPAEIMRRFVVSGLDANPVTDEEKRLALKRMQEKARGELPGLVVPMAPMASASTSANSADEKEWRGGRDSNP